MTGVSGTVGVAGVSGTVEVADAVGVSSFGSSVVSVLGTSESALSFGSNIVSVF